MGELVGPTEAGERLGVNKSTVSRQVAKLGIPTDSRGRFDYGAYLAARDANINGLKARNREAPVAAPAAAPDLLDASEGEAEDAPPASRGGARPTLTGAAVEEREWRAKRERLRYLREVGELVSLAEVEAARLEESAALLQAMMAVARDLAPELAELGDPREVRQLMEDTIRARLEALSDDFTVPADDGAGAGQPPAGGQPAGGPAGGPAGRPAERAAGLA